VKDKDYHLLFRSVNEGSFQFLKVRGLMNEVVKFVIGSLVLDVMMIFSRTSMLRAPGASF
jgi:hypothetical protein